jgi:hypothetical protein
MWPLSSGTAWMTRLPFISQKPGQTWRPSVTNHKRRYGDTQSRSRSRLFKLASREAYATQQHGAEKAIAARLNSFPLRNLALWIPSSC